MPRAGWFFVPKHAQRAEGQKTTQLEASPCEAGLHTTESFFCLDK
jgi:hypothetical protein